MNDDLHYWSHAVSGQMMAAMGWTQADISRAIINALTEYGYAIGMDYQMEVFLPMTRDQVVFTVMSFDSEVLTVMRQEFHMPL